MRGLFLMSFSTLATMNYRRLHKEELEAVKDEFVRFLAANSVAADDWTKLKSNDPVAAESMLDVFSDIFWEKALTKIPAVEQRSSSSLRVMRFYDDKAELVEIRLPENSRIDFTKANDLQLLAAGEVDIAQLKPELFIGTHQYHTTRNLEMFKLIEAGAQPCKEAMYLGLKAMVKPQ